MDRSPNISVLLKRELSGMLSPGESKKQYLDETRRKRSETKKELLAQGFSKQEANKMIQDINSYRNKIFSYCTLEVYMKAADAYAEFCEEHLGTKRISLEEAKKHVQEFVYWGIEKEHSPATIHTRLSAVCKALGLNIADYDKPARHYSKTIRSTYDAQNDDYNSIRAETALTVNRLLGLRRSELKRVRLNDINIISDDYAEVYTRGKGGKKNVNILITEDEVSQLKLYMIEAESQGREFLLPSDVFFDADLHHARAQRACDVYSAIYARIQANPACREYYKSEVKRAFEANGKKLRENLDVPYRCRGENKKRLIKMGKKTIFDRVVVLYVSVFILNHYRSDTTVTHYLIKAL